MKSAILAVCCLAAVASGQEWVDTLGHRYGGERPGVSLALSDESRLYVLASNNGMLMGTHALLSRYKLDGTLVWTETLAFGSQSNPMFSARVAAGKNIAAVALVVDYHGRPREFHVFGFDSNGTQVWHHDYGSDTRASFCDITVSAGDTVHVTGPVVPVSDSSSILTARYEPSGSPVWERYWTGHGGASDVVRCMALGPSGSVYIAGQTVSEDGATKPTVLKYLSDGTLDWVRRIGHPDTSDGGFRAIAVSQDTLIYAAGVNDFDPQASPVACLAPDGEVRWRRYLPAKLTDLDVDGQGSLCVAGVSAGPADFETWMMGHFGAVLWHSTWDGPGNLADEPRAIVVDPSGNVVVTGWSECSDPPGARTISTVKYSQAGDFKWAVHYRLHDNDMAMGNDIAADQGDNIYITGQVTHPYQGGAMCLTMCYPPTPTGVTMGRATVGQDPGGQTFCRGVLPLAGSVEAALLDIVGRRVMCLRPGNNEA
ncbi:MAG: PQQ-binding-like beta-propeller repeat protein, partial [candidate division WOR-3 bacterium]